MTSPMPQIIYSWEKSHFFGFVKVKYYIEDRGEKASTRYKNFIYIDIGPFIQYRWTYRTPHVYDSQPYGDS